MTTRAFRMKLKPGMVDEYKRRHDTLWPDLGRALGEAGIYDYSIFLDEETLHLFAVLKLWDDHKIEALPGKAVMQRWWDHMADLMEVEPGNRPREWPLVPMFHFA
jgi:L-rhamnose mutarotase